MAERLDKSGLTRLWRAIQLKIASMVKTYSLTKSGDTLTLSDNSGTDSTVTLGIPVVNNASTSSPGVVQLSTSTSSTSTTMAATPSAVKAAYDRASTAIDTKLTNDESFSGNFDVMINQENGLHIISDTSSISGTLPAEITISDYDVAYFNTVGSDSNGCVIQEMTLIAYSANDAITDLKRLIRLSDGSLTTDWAYIPNATGVLF